MSFLKQMFGLEGASQTGNSTSTYDSTSKTTLDPAVHKMIFGDNGSAGLLNRFQGYLDQPQSAGMQDYNKAAGDYLSNYGAGAMGQIQGTAAGLQAGNGTALTSLPAYATGSNVNAPSQNNINLSGSYQNLLGGGDTSKLMDSLQAGNALAGAQFKQNQSDLTDNLQRNILPGIRSNSVLAGQYGGSRQGVAEGLAISDLTKQLNNSNTQFGLGATAANSSALAGAYENGQNRALSATQGLGAQQYGIASQNAANANNAEFMNVNNLYDATKTNAAATNQMTQANDQSALAGAGLLGNLMNQSYGITQNADNYGINRAGQVNGLLSPYLNANSTTTVNGSTTKPIYENRGQQFVAAMGNMASMFG